MDIVKQELISAGYDQICVEKCFEGASSIRDAYNNAGLLLSTTFNENYSSIYKALGERLVTVDQHPQNSAFYKVNSESLTADNTANQQVEQLTDHKDELESLRAQVDQLKAEKSVDTKKSSKLKTAVKVVGTMAAALGVPVALLLAKKNPFESLPLLKHMIEFLEKNGSNGLTFK